MGSVRGGKVVPFWQDISDESKRTSTMNTPPTLAGLPAIPKAGSDASDIATKEAAMQGLNQRIQQSKAPKYPLGDPSQTPIGSKTLLGS